MNNQMMDLVLAQLVENTEKKDQHVVADVVVVDGDQQVVAESKSADLTKEQLLAMVSELAGRVAEMQKGGSVVSEVKVAKNHREGKATAGRKYTLKAGKLAVWGKVPQQQQDIAGILIRNMEVGKEYTEAEVFGFLVEGRDNCASLRASQQDVTYLFRYYRGLKNDGKYAGFIGRDFLTMVG